MEGRNLQVFVLLEIEAAPSHAAAYEIIQWHDALALLRNFAVVVVSAKVSLSNRVVSYLCIVLILVSFCTD